MVNVVSTDDLRLSERAARFEGRDYGSTVSFFVTAHPPGSGARLHRHPYEETFIVQEGVGTFTVDDDEFAAGAGHIVVVPAGAAHKFTNLGEGIMRLVGIHPSDHVVQEELGD